MADPTQETEPRGDAVKEQTRKEEYEKKASDDIWWLPTGAQIKVIVYEFSKEPFEVLLTKFEGGWFSRDGYKYNQDGTMVGRTVSLWSWEFKSVTKNPLNPILSEPEPEPDQPSRFAKFVGTLLVLGGLVGFGIYIWKLCKSLIFE